jgi:outer membrane protein
MTKRLLPTLFLSLCLPAVASAKAYKLDEILDLARKGNPGLVAGARATAGIEAQLREAKSNYLPTGELYSMLAQAPEIRCYDAAGNRDEYNCQNTTGSADKSAVGTSPSSFLDGITPKGVFTRTELKLIQPVYTFGKISAGVAAAKEGVKASQERQGGLLADLELNIRKAYWGAKLARAILVTLNEGSGYLDQAQKKIEDELADGSGEATITDRLRLRTMRADIDARILEANRGVSLARSGIRALIGPDAPADLDIDEADIEALAVPGRTIGQYEDAALQTRPEVKALQHLVASKQALAQLETRRQYPDFVLVGTAAYAYASSVDNPKNSYYSNPFHSYGVGLAAGFRMPLDLGIKHARASKLRAEAEEADQRRREALSGISFEVEKAHTELKEAEERMKVVQKGEKAGKQWIAAIAQNLAVGLAEAKDFSDALLAFFQARIRCAQSIYDYNIAAAALTRATGADVTSAGL